MHGNGLFIVVVVLMAFGVILIAAANKSGAGDKAAGDKPAADDAKAPGIAAEKPRTVESKLPWISGKTPAMPVPTYRAKKLLTDNEVEFFGRLRSAMPDHYIFPQVSMGALMEPRAFGIERWTHFNKISSKRVDYAIYTRDLRLVAVVELDDRTHDAKRDAVRDEMLASAGIRTVRFQSRLRPGVEGIKKAVFAGTDMGAAERV